MNYYYVIIHFGWNICLCSCLPRHSLPDIHSFLVIIILQDKEVSQQIRDVRWEMAEWCCAMVWSEDETDHTLTMASDTCACLHHGSLWISNPTLSSQSHVCESTELAVWVARRHKKTNNCTYSMFWSWTFRSFYIELCL